MASVWVFQEGESGILYSVLRRMYVFACCWLYLYTYYLLYCRLLML